MRKKMLAIKMSKDNQLAEERGFTGQADHRLLDV